MKLKPFLLTLLALPLSAIATENTLNEPKNTVAFTVEAEKEVALDVLQVKLFVQEENANLKALHDTISAKLNAALAKIKAESAIIIKSNNRHTSVRYNNKGRKDGWIERADLVLESRDSYALSQVIDAVSEQLSIEYVNAVLSPEAREKLDEELTQTALAKFQRKAELIKNGLQMKGYRIVSLDTNSPSQAHYGETREYVGFAAEAKMSSAPVQIETGSASVKTRINAVIELIQN